MNLLVVAALAWAIGLPQFGTHNTILTAAEHPNSLTEDYPIKLDASYNTDFGAEHGNVYGHTHEEKYKFHRLDCYEKVEKPDRLHSRRDWEWDEDRLALESPVDVVVVRDGNDNSHTCSERLECRAMVRLIKGRREACDLRENFYVGNDGNVYEGRGWHVAPYGHLLGLRRHAITVRFFGYTASPPALQAYAMLIKSGVWKGHLSRDYKVIAMGRLLNDSRFSSYRLVKTVEGWERRTDVARLSSRWEFVVPHRLTLIFREEWNGSTPNGIHSRPPKNVELVMISESGEGCRSQVECSAWIKRYQDEQIRADGDLEHNFYITEEGDVLEGLGWDSVAYSELSGIREDYVSIQLCGKFTSTPPSRKAINSLKLLVASGVGLGMIRRDYRLLPSSLGSAFQKYVEGWSVRPDRI